MKPWHVYILRCGDGTLYCGIALNVEARLEAHRSGKGARYTRGRGPLELVHIETCATKGEALRRERQIKALPRARKQERAGIWRSEADTNAELNTTPLQPLRG